MKLFFTLLLFFLSTSLFAQYQIRAVTLTDRNDNVLPGYIKYYDWNNNPESIEFGKDSSGIIKTLLLQNIQKLVVKDGPILEGLYLKVQYYTKGPVTPGVSIVHHIDSTYYLSELLLDSEATKLYRFFDNDKNLRFVISKYDSLVMLENVHISISRKEKVYDYKEPVFRKTLLVSE
jgi:hypothetical protein